MSSCGWYSSYVTNVLADNNNFSARQCIPYVHGTVVNNHGGWDGKNVKLSQALLFEILEQSELVLDSCGQDGVLVCDSCGEERRAMSHGGHQEE